MKLVVCVKQVPMVSELPWDAKTGTLKREHAEGMMNPACKHALEAAIRIKEKHGGDITVLSMGPSQAEEVLREALGMGADRGVLLTSRRMAGADTLATSYTLACAVRKVCPDFDLILCGAHTSDSETWQVGPQMMEELDVPGVACVEEFELNCNILRMKRESDDFLETLEMELPGLITVSTRHNIPRYVSFAGVENAFDEGQIEVLDVEAIGADPARIGIGGSPTKILSVYSPTAEKKGVLIKGSAKKAVEELFDKFGDLLGGVIGKDLA